MSKALDKMIKARTRLILDNPFFGTLSLRLKLIEDKTIPTMCTNGSFLKFGPDFVEKLSFDEVMGVVAHEVMHVVYKHPLRMHKDWHPGYANIAADYTINGDLERAGFRLPDHHVGFNDDKYTGMFLEEVYKAMVKENPPPPPIQVKIGVQQGGGQGDGGEGKGQQGQSKADLDPGGNGYFEAAESPSGASEPTEAEIKEMEAEVDMNTVQAAQVAKMMGQGNIWIDRLIKDLTDPIVDWRILLQRFVEQTAKNDYNWSYPNRRYMQQGIYLPTLISQEVGTGTVVCDTSGSVSIQELQQYASEISAIVETFNGISIDVMYCAHDLDPNIDHFEFGDFPIQLNPGVSGGTDFRPPFNYIEKHGIRPTFLIYFTDMECDRFPDFTPNYPVLWLSTSKKMWYGKPPFGEVVYIEPVS